jgi:SAM-dependent methyltransferase
METAEYDLMDAVEARMWWYRALHRRLLDALAPVRGAVLDAGCGTGGFLAVLREARPDLGREGLEWDAGAAARAAKKGACVVTPGSVNAMPYETHGFDALILADVLCHVAVEPAHALAEARRVLRPGGRLVINMPAYAWLMSTHDRRVHNSRRLTARATRLMLTQAGFARVTTQYWNSLLLPLMIVQRKILARGDSASDVANFPPWLDATLHAVTRLERALPLPMPAGGSVLAIAENPQVENPNMEKPSVEEP